MSVQPTRQDGVEQNWFSDFIHGHELISLLPTLAAAGDGEPWLWMYVF